MQVNESIEVVIVSKRWLLINRDVTNNPAPQVVGQLLVLTPVAVEKLPFRPKQPKIED